VFSLNNATFTSNTGQIINLNPAENPGQSPSLKVELINSKVQKNAHDQAIIDIDKGATLNIRNSLVTENYSRSRGGVIAAEDQDALA